MSPRIPVPAPRSSTVSPGVTTSSIAWRKADRRLASARYCRCSSRTSDIRRSRRSGDAVSQASRHHHGARVAEDRSARVRQLLDGSILDEARLHVGLLLRRLERRVLRGLFGHGLSSWVCPVRGSGNMVLYHSSVARIIQICPRPLGSPRRRRSYISRIRAPTTYPSASRRSREKIPAAPSRSSEAANRYVKSPLVARRAT